MAHCVDSCIMSPVNCLYLKVGRHFFIDKDTSVLELCMTGTRARGTDTSDASLAATESTSSESQSGSTGTVNGNL